MADKLAGVRPGDILVMSGTNMRGSVREVTVTRVGRLYLYTETFGRESKWSIETGVIADNYGHENLRTKAQVAADIRRWELLNAIREAGFRPIEFQGKRISTETLQRVADALK